MSITVLDLPDPILTENANEVLARRYLKKDEHGVPIETPKDMFLRVAQTIAQEDEKYGGNVDTFTQRYYEMMSQGYWLPNSPTLMNAGRPLGQLSACFVLPVEDCMSNGENGIYDTLKDMALIHQSGGGTGFSFSRLRSNGSFVKTTAGVASGPVSFMSLYDASTNVVKQGGTRRGANMGILRVDHPDILEFIDCKQNTSQIVNFNISVAVTNDFMEKAKAGSDYFLVDHKGQQVGTLNAAEVLDRIIKNAWNTGEPGLFFIDQANFWNPVPHIGQYEATNPCGEQPLFPYDVCNLGSLNLSKFVVTTSKTIDWNSMRYYIDLSTQFLDNVVDANNYPLAKIKTLAHRIRRIGNGVMGLADMLIKLRIPYDSEEGFAVAEEVANFFREECHNTSERLAEHRGVFPEWEHSIWGPNDARLPERKMRNCNVTTVAPTGTISIIAGCSSGIEPIFALSFTRNQAGTIMTEKHPELENASEKEIDTIFKTANQISPREHIGMQAIWQRHCDSAISKTINFAREATIEDVKSAYLFAYAMNLKGITVYRDGSRPNQVLSTDKTTQPKNTSKLVERPDKVSGITHKIVSPLGKMYVTVNEVKDKPFEVFINVGKAGGEAGANAEAIGRLLSIALQHGVPIERLYKQLRGISSERALGFGAAKVLSGPDAVAQVLQRYTNGRVRIDLGESAIGSCQDCGSTLAYGEGCLKCEACGYSECG